MKSLFLANLFLICCILQSCQKDDLSESIESTRLLDQRIVIDGIEREYHLQIPGEPANKPIVILLHGHGGSANQSIGAELTKAPQQVWLTVAEEQRFTVVVPNGLRGSEDKRGWNDCRSDATGNPDSDDVKFLSNLIDFIIDEYEIDDKRVYVAGVSNGASMAIRLVQEIPEKVAAFASVVATMPVDTECPDSTIPVSALFMNGTEDSIAPYEGGQVAGNRGEVQSTIESLNYWIARNKTWTTPIETTFEDLDPNDASTAVKYLYTNGADNTEVAFYQINGGGHTEPSLVERYSRLYLAVAGEQNGDIEMAREVWDFFKTKSK